jgi:hypothetical protein
MTPCASSHAESPALYENNRRFHRLLTTAWKPSTAVPYGGIMGTGLR